MVVFNIKTAAGLLLVIIACLVVSMLGYHAYAEGLTQNNARTNRITTATGNRESAPSKVVKKNEKKNLNVDYTFAPSTKMRKYKEKI